MINDYLELRNAEGMPKLVDGTIALAFLANAKNGVRNCGIALTEAATPEVRNILRAQLENAINLHEEISKLMINRGWFHPYDLSEQFELDIRTSGTVAQITDMDLFPGNTNRLGVFATPEK